MSKAARIRYTADWDYVDKQAKEFTLTPEVIEKIDSVEPSAERNAIQWIKVNWELQEPDRYRVVSLAIPEVVDALDSYSATDALSAKQGRVLYNKIHNLESLGKFLSNWDATMWLPVTNPEAIPYTYNTWDYYIVGRVGATNYRPSGTSYRGLPSTTVETDEVKIWDFYFYDWAVWTLLLNTERPIAIDTSLSTTSTNPVENRVVTNAINLKANDADISVVGKSNDYNDLDNLPSIPDSLDDLTGTADDITEGSTNLFLTTAERGKLANTSGVNTGDETQASIMSKLWVASTSTNGYLTSSDWNTFNDKQDAISDLATIRSNAADGKTAKDTIDTYWDIVTHDVSEFATAAQGAKADTAIQPLDNVSELTNDAGYVTAAYHDSTKQDVLVAGNNIQIAQDWVTISATDTTYTASDFDIKDLADSTGKRTEWDAKQDALTAGTNIQIAQDGTISATDTTYTAGPWISISNNNVISAADVNATWGNITGTLSNQTDLQSALDDKQDNLVAGTNIQIAADWKTISATDTTYTAWVGIDITNNVISNTNVSAEWWNIIWDIDDQQDLQLQFSWKQDGLIAWANVQIAADGKTISATDTTYTASDFDIKNLSDSDSLRNTWSAKQDALVAGSNIQIAADWKTISATDTTYAASDFDIKDLADSTSLRTTWSWKQDKLIAWNNIQIAADGKTISATDTTYSASDFDIKDLTDSLDLRDAWTNKQDAINDLSTIRSGAALGATSVQPLDNITTLTNNAGYITKSVNNLDNYYKKSETYTRAEIENLIANFSWFEVVATLPTTDIKTNIIYLLGPVGSGADKYEEYIYSNNTWIKIWETSIDLSNYFNYVSQTADAITEWSTNLFLTSAERTKLSNTSGTNTWDETKQTIQTKLWVATSTNSWYLTASDWSTFNAKQKALTAWSNIQIASDGTISATDTTYTASDFDIKDIADSTSLRSTWNAKQDAISDLATIRSWAAAGATALQPAAISDNMYGSGWDADSTHAPSKNAVYDKISAMDVTIAWKEDTISDLSTIRSNASNWKDAYDTIANYGDVVSHNASEFLTSSAINNTAYGSGWNNDTTHAPSKDAVYDKINAMDTTIGNKANTSDVLTKTNTGSYTPSSDYHPATKKYVDDNISSATAGAVSDTAYAASWNWVTGIAPSKNAVYDKISAMDTTIAGKQDTISDLATIRSWASKWATAVQPSDNVSTLANDAGYITSASLPTKVSQLTNDSGFITKSVSDLTNYYTKSNTYTKSEVDSLVQNFQWFEVVATLPTTDIKTNVIYLLGPTWSGADKYEEYIYSSNAWVKIGDTSVDLTNYFNKSTQTSDAITEGSTNLFMTSAERTKLWNQSGTNTWDETASTIKTKLWITTLSGSNTWDETQATIKTKLGAASSTADWYLTKTDWTTFNNKQATISDLSTIRSWASAGATAVQPWDLATIATTGALEDASGTSDDITEGTTNLFLTSAERTKLSNTSGTNTGDETASTIKTKLGITTLSWSNTWDETASTIKTKLWAATSSADGYLKSTDFATFSAKLDSSAISDTAYGSGWNWVTSTAPSKNAVYDKIAAMDTTISWKLDSSAISDTAYAPSWNWVTTIAPSKNAVYDKLSSMDTTIAGKQATISDLATIRSWAAAWATAIQPDDNVSTLTNDAGYITSASLPTKVSQLTNDSGFITSSVNNLTNYYTKSNTYTKSEVDSLVQNFQWFEVVATLPTTDIKTNVIYLLGPTGSWADKYEEYIYASSAWVKIWDTSVDLTNYFNKTTNTSDNITQWSTNLFVTSSEKSTWNGKQNALTAQTAYTSKWSATKVPQITTNSLWQVTWITEVTITQPTVPTNVSAFNNDVGYITSSSLPTKVSDLDNDAGYTTNTGTITWVKMNWSTVASSGVADLGTITTTRGTAASGGTTLSLVNTWDMYTWNNKQAALSNITASDIKTGTATAQKTVTASVLASALPTLSSQSNNLAKIKVWAGTQAQYDALGSYDSQTLYFTTDA